MTPAGEIEDRWPGSITATRLKQKVNQLVEASTAQGG
jgi:hypothetical protein